MCCIELAVPSQSQGNEHFRVTNVPKVSSTLLTFTVLTRGAKL